MTSKQRRRSNDDSHDPRESNVAARKAARQVAEQDGDLEVDPASELFFEFAAPLLLETGNEEEFESAVTIAEFVWSATHFSAAEQAFMLDEFIREANIPEDMVPWLIEVYSQLAARKEELVG